MTTQVLLAKHLGYLALSSLLIGAPLAEAARFAGHGGGGVRAHSSVSHARAASQPRVQPNRNIQRPPVRRDNNVNINKNVNINDNRNYRHGDVDIDVDHHGWGWNEDVDIDVDHNGRGDWDIDVDVDHHHPVATAAIVTGSVLAIGSMINSLPPNCQQVYRHGNEYYYCNNQYYQPQWNNNTVVYVVVNNP
ncbi:hypothetical protein [Pseudomonas sp. RL_15y_Pfl2_60]|uniref:hypothetical protein n=1 Tax=Pseudomonas sp. RL_15y_Pfl2_60 TaxID=3088709 RepID=UPI0030D9A4CD